MAIYVRGKYYNDINSIYGMHYPSVSDARILFSAWQEDCILVTNNIKDFMLLPILNYSPEVESLYDPINNWYVNVGELALRKIMSDSEFEAMFSELNEMIES
ncbi:hypothetical protein [Halalkalibacter akibai]